MMQRSLTSAGVAALLAILALTAVPVAGQAPAPAAKNGASGKAYVPPKTAGRPAGPVGILDGLDVYSVRAPEKCDEGVLHA